MLARHDISSQVSVIGMRCVNTPDAIEWHRASSSLLDTLSCDCGGISPPLQASVTCSVPPIRLARGGWSSGRLHYLHFEAHRYQVESHER